jgi:hypothetical protein
VSSQRLPLRTSLRRHALQRVPRARTPVCCRASIGFVHAPPASGSLGGTKGLTSSSIDPALPITMYTEAAAKSTYCGAFYVSGCMHGGAGRKHSASEGAQPSARTHFHVCMSAGHCHAGQVWWPDVPQRPVHQADGRREQAPGGPVSCQPTVAP